MRLHRGRATAAGLLCAVAATVGVWSGPLLSASGAMHSAPATAAGTAATTAAAAATTVQAHTPAR